MPSRTQDAFMDNRTRTGIIAETWRDLNRALIAEAIFEFSRSKRNAHFHYLTIVRSVCHVASIRLTDHLSKYTVLKVEARAEIEAC
jgi:hypothetical protein